MSPFHPDRPEVPRLPDAPASVRPEPRPRPLPLYQVVLHGDGSQDLMFVIRCVMELTRFPRAEATYKMWQAHHCGRSVILVTYRERAELYAEQFADKGLTVTVEPA
jgi:ATP-dependent Clp protease adapter protein ClpS